MRDTVQLTVERDVPTRMRDGTALYADVYRPAAAGKYPVILLRTPYNKSFGRLAYLQLDPMRAASQGYVLIIQDTRGRFNSEGEFYCFAYESQDGYDTVEWAVAQPWSDGHVGMYGASYMGATQWLAAIAQPPHLQCIVPLITAADYHEGWTYQGGAFALGFNLTGHRIRVEISSSNFPRFDRNPNTGHPFAQDAELRQAAQTILHDADHPSHIVLPIVPR
jgi:uncharacterized protein